MIKLLSIAIALVLSTQAWAAEEEVNNEQPLAEQLKALDLENQAPVGVSKEKLYSVQDRFMPLKNRSEVWVGVAQNLSGDSYLVTRQVELGYRFHFNNRWSVSADYAFVDNKFTDAANELLRKESIIPDVPYAKTRMDLLVGFNAFYGKFRLTMDRVLYFDQYFAVGPGLMEMNTGQTTAAVVDAGFVFWVEKLGSVRLGLKDYMYEEKRTKSASLAQNIHGHLDIGYVF